MSNLSRRRFLTVTTGAAALPAMPAIARAAIYPTRSVLVLVGFAAGGPGDITARLISDWLSKRLGKEFIVENRPGAGGNIATEAVVRAKPDGYTLLLFSPSACINATLYKHLDFDFIRDIAPIATIMQSPDVLEVNPSLPVKTVPEFIAYAKAHPGKLNLGTAGNGDPAQMAGELFMRMTGVKMTVVGYRGGGPALLDLLRGQVQVMFNAIPSSIGYIRSSKLRPLGVTSAKRSPALPDVPAIGEFVPGYASSVWFGLGAPNNTPQPVIDTLSNEIKAGLADPTIKAHIAKLGAEPMRMDPAQFGKLIREDTKKWAEVIRSAHISIE
jgi:tripartite-type tricarboxylate transporter receptor subunit TctC